MTEILSLRLYGTVCTQVIFPLSTLSVLRDNDAVVEIELLVPDTLPTSAESSGSNSSYFTNQVISGLHLVNVGKGQQGSLEETMSVGFTPSFGLKQQVVREGPHRFLRQRQQPSSPRSSLPQPNVVTGVWQLPLPRPLFDFGRPSNLPKSRQPWRCGARSATARRLSTKQSAVAPPCVVRRTPPPSFAEKPIDCVAIQAESSSDSSQAESITSKPSRASYSPSHLSLLPSTSGHGVRDLMLDFPGFTTGLIGVSSPLLGWIRWAWTPSRGIAKFQVRDFLLLDLGSRLET
ncbi:hypothetical protein E6C27_scaffold60G003970 [Cucumis melo var. makuwa]|uniref:Uncharacterized protein n=1 Tax=Cucumis melo var. makuwa TaxID=1194695 RepID=A0A5A7U9T8_CUCMM|nr:hypothetical protein E6C27_scaffold60G003970 [Cucumis melo var. makuwa]